jgi:hypothetical protein
MSEKSIKSWKNPDNYVNKEEYRQILSDRASKNQNTGIFKGGYSRGKMGKYLINGKEIFFRSLWESNYALYLDFLIKQNKILKWEYESETFWFLEIKRGVRSYKPDFKVYNIDGSIVYHEVKGYMDNKSKTKLNRMRIYYPNIKIELICQKEYKAILSSLNGIIEFYK